MRVPQGARRAARDRVTVSEYCRAARSLTAHQGRLLKLSP